MRDGFADRTNDEFLQEVLSKVNELRARHGSSLLTLDLELVEYSKSRASFMAEKGNLTHEGLRPDTGENGSWAGASTGPTAGSGTAAVDSWYSEISNYDFATGKAIDSTKAIGHFTALVWKNTTKLGVGRVAGQGAKWWETFIVANFSPPGNMGGQYVMNVTPAS
ncbi:MULTISPECIES: CAP family protein [Micromonospora]|uniref:CAP family protein n=1 Tax=Micromonospora TaxID=1873 RepID=UPI001EE8BCAA|nr:MULTISPECIES: CAP family protein [Micromonospora]MCG5451187.1 CAP family protein [Micromonospora hortensis]MCX5116396.1 CAP family protein [Micromonospora sp. NBC_00362]WTI05339.1 CAP family protein [Micromonospora sp. NBC_00821]